MSDTVDIKVQQIPPALRHRITAMTENALALDAQVAQLAAEAIALRNDFYDFEATLRHRDDDFDDALEDAAGYSTVSAAFGAIALRASAVHEGDRCNDWWIREHGFHGLGIREAVTA